MDGSISHPGMLGGIKGEKNFCRLFTDFLLIVLLLLLLWGGYRGHINWRMLSPGQQHLLLGLGIVLNTREMPESP